MKNADKIRASSDEELAEALKGGEVMRLIDADALELFLKTARQGLFLDKTIKDFDTRDNMLLNFQQYVHLQPIVDAVPVVHGQWIIPEKFSEAMRPLNGLGVICDQCHIWSDNTYNYCPYCGCKMMEDKL